ncbi:MAG TPA: hypothetical protein VI815_02315 [Candidatus Nanoarchaeia archaeon]|nr:hypothetical protein [Candidatus Nanoarchaeia archaeon]
MKQDVIAKVYVNADGVDLGTTFIKAHYTNPDFGIRPEWEEYKDGEQRRIDAINAISKHIGSMVILFTWVELHGAYSISATFHFKEAFVSHGLLIKEEYAEDQKIWDAFIKALLNDEQWNDVFAEAGVDRTILFYCESY